MQQEDLITSNLKCEYCWNKNDNNVTKRKGII